MYLLPLIYKVMLRRFFSQRAKFDLVVVGGGPGGYVTAIKAAQLGLKTACVEKSPALGGTCLNVGCIPSKALLNISHKFHDMKNAAHYGLVCPQPSFDWAQVQKKKSGIVRELTQGIDYLFRKNGVTLLRGEGKLTSATTVSVAGEEVEARNIVIATGSEPRKLDGFPFDEQRIVSSTGCLSLEKVPNELLVIGAGVIGLELGSVYRRLGSRVVVVEFADRVFPALDRQVGDEFTKSLRRDGIEFLFGKKCLSSRVEGGRVSLTVEDRKSAEKAELSADVVLVAVGRQPHTSGLGLEKLGVSLDQFGRIPVNETFQTSLPTVFAIGDVIEGPMLAHKASEEGIAVAELLAGHHVHVNYNAIPNVIYTHPEIAWVGKTEEQLREAAVKYRLGSFPFSANSRAKANLDVPIGMVKVLVEDGTDKVLGAHIMAPNAGELIHEFVLGIEYGASSEDIARASHAHPSLSEAVKEACLAAHSKPIHI